MTIKHFRAGNGLVLTLPLGLKAAPGAQHLRLDDKTTASIDMDAPETRPHMRFLTMALRDGDLVEEKSPLGGESDPKSPPAATSAKFQVNPGKE